MSAASDSIVEKVYLRIRDMAIDFEFKPGERLNEVALSKELGVSRTPLREALNRLSIEGLLRFLPGKGFFCRDLDVQEIFALYELRKSLEVSALRLAIQRATDNDIRDALSFLDSTGPEAGERSVAEMVALDEAFHERIMAMSGNAEMLRVLKNVNARIRFVRWIDMNRGDRPASQREHHRLLEALQARNEAEGVAILEQHIDRRMDQITSAIREGYAHIYMPDASRRQ
ncbi:GntR family transcriptional regulator [Achromobacter arsenitoxydans]|uniref:GntR family transcriptional regulator n=1 Tax=Achromobacter arsenitoxydans SY8 TaxID=477184 RepID=H0F818_9BURK|nr:GntR family transcriptional regulator [Achromobacter arsenitoxydans]EHK65451.1 GntR family transcriptional regulator [Achromobacter arsenitoxydans SY8]